jgi:copper chaperone NosL
MRVQLRDGRGRKARFVIRYNLAMSLIMAILLTVGCDQDPEIRNAISPQAIDADDECHVCGMIINRFPGPKGEAFVVGNVQALKFCSTRDLFAFLLQPEADAIVRGIYVHDMAGTDWRHPPDAALIDARLAWYVVNHSKRGAMGPTLASFRYRADAQAFTERYGGSLLRFEQVDLEEITNLDYGNGINEMDNKHDLGN